MTPLKDRGPLEYRQTQATDRAADSARRAEEIRRRRTSRSQERITQVSSRISNPVQPRPVTVRGSERFTGKSDSKKNGAQTPIYRQAATRPRRQYYVAVDSASGSELRLPAIPFINPGWRILSAILAILAVIGVFSLLNSPFFRVYTVDVQGLERLSGTDLLAVVRLENLSIIEIQPGMVKEAISVSFPELADVQVEVALPNVVTVRARERQPVLAWQQDDSLRWIDTEGYVFPARGEAGPLVTINTDDEIPLAPLSADEMAKLQALAESNPLVAAQASQIAAGLAINGLPAGSDALRGILGTAANINRKADLALLNASLLLIQKLPEGTTIVYDKMNGLGWSDPQGWQVFIGKDLENFEAKFALYQALTNMLNDQGIRPYLISVEHLNAPFYRVEATQEVSN
jgi:cell division protein FtsQ